MTQKIDEIKLAALPQDNGYTRVINTKTGQLIGEWRDNLAQFITEACNIYYKNKRKAEIYDKLMANPGRTHITARKLALAEGKKTYNTGLPCKYGHMSDRYVSTKSCIACEEYSYRAWVAIKLRCHNPNGRDYHNYGGRGIKVCDRWLQSFEDFKADMGERPHPSYSIDRINNDGDYEPSNCRWASKNQQCRNTRRAINAKHYHQVLSGSFVVQFTLGNKRIAKTVKTEAEAIELAEKLIKAQAKIEAEGK